MRGELSTSDSLELTTARKEARGLEDELREATRRASEVFEVQSGPGAAEVVTQVASDGLPVKATCRVPDVSAPRALWKQGKLSPRSMRHALIASTIRPVCGKPRRAPALEVSMSDSGREASPAWCSQPVNW